MAGISTKAAGSLISKEKTFQGQRFDDDLGINWIQFKWRNHDPQIGRFIEIDPLSEKYSYNSTYTFSENKVTVHVELEGLEAFFIHGTMNNSNRWRANKSTIPQLMKLTNNKTSNAGFNWDAPLTNNEKKRGIAAQQLANYVIKNRVKDEPITLIGHSHGGNVAIQASKLIFEQTNQKVNIITIETPAFNKKGDIENPATQKSYINDHIALWNKIDIVAGGVAGDHYYTNSSVTRNVEVNVDNWYIKEKEVNAGHGETNTVKIYDGIGAHSWDIEHPCKYP